MNIALKIDDTDWQNFLHRATAIMRSSDSLLKRAFLVIWPKDATDHFDKEQGWDGPWAPWKTSTRAARISHEIRSAIGKQHAGGRLSAADRERGERRVQARRGRDYAKGKVYNRGGKLLVKTGRLRTQTVQDPIITEALGHMKVESPTPYSGFLDEGTSKMVARPFMWLTDDAQERLASVFMQFLGDGADI